jgi:GPH family glycoside/pentoside/hexuronide:cation symporter
MLFSIPPQLEGVGLLIYATGCSIALRVSLSFFNLPYIAVGAEVSDDYQERSSIVSYRICFSMLGAFLAILLGLGVFMAGPHGLVNRQAYARFGWSCALVLAAAGWISAFATRSVLPRLHEATAIEGPVVRRFLSDLGDIFRNRSFVVLFGACVAFFVAQGVGGALALPAGVISPTGAHRRHAWPLYWSAGHGDPVPSDR